MRAWAYMLGGLLLWTLHFFSLYAAGSLFLTTTTTRIIVLVVTLACLGAAAWLTRAAWRRRGDSGDPFGTWTHHIAALSGATGCIAIFWQGLPAILI